MRGDPVLLGKKAIVTGGARGIGAGITRSLLEKGAKVAIFDIDEEALSAARSDFAVFGDQVAAAMMDIADPPSVESGVAWARARMNGLDILVNNAAIGGEGRHMVDLSLEEWERMLRVDLTGPFIVTKEVLRGMIAQKRGKIINITSVAGIEGAAGSIPYSAAKAGVHGLTKSLAREVAQHFINVNAIAPGLVDTRMSRARPQTKKIPWPRIGLPADIGETAAFLASDASDFITGQIIEVSGGTHM